MDTSRRGRGDEDESLEAGWASGGNCLCDLSAHAVPDKDVVLQTEDADEGEAVIGEVGDPEAGGCGLGVSPAAVVISDTAKRGTQTVCYGSPGAARPEQPKTPSLNHLHRLPPQLHYRQTQ